MSIDPWQIIKVMWSILRPLWPIWAIFLAIFLVQSILNRLDLEIDNWRIRRRFKKGAAWRSNRELLGWLRTMSPDEFEDYIANLFSQMGYKTEAIGGPHDGGIDVIAEKDGIKHYIQCKKFVTSEVHVGDVRDFYGAIADHLANGTAYFITTNKFTLDTQLFAEDKPIQLIDGPRLIEYIRLIEKSK